MRQRDEAKKPENRTKAPEETQETADIGEIEILDEMPPEDMPAEDANAAAFEDAEAMVREQEDKYMRLLAEYDNFRRRSIKEREMAWSTAKAETAAAFFPVYDNLERALKQECKDEAYAKGVRITMQQLKGVLEKLGVEEIPAQGELFDPSVHDAVMHVEDESKESNVIVEVFQTGFRSGEKVIRHAMVKVAN